HFQVVCTIALDIAGGICHAELVRKLTFQRGVVANDAVVLSHCLHNQHLACRTLDVGGQVGQVGFCIGDAACSKEVVEQHAGHLGIGIGLLKVQILKIGGDFFRQIFADGQLIVELGVNFVGLLL